MQIISLLLISLILGAAAQGPSHPPAIVPAYVEPQGLLFDPPVPLAWSAMVPARLRLRNLQADTTGWQRLSRERSESGNLTELTFPARVPPALLGRVYHTLDATGVHVIRPTGLLGTVRISWKGASTQVADFDTYGKVRAPARAGGIGGFVIITDGPATFTAVPSHLTAAALKAARGGDFYDTGQSTAALDRILRQYEVRQTAPSSDRWLFVQWSPEKDGVMCSLRFDLFHLDPKLVLVAGAYSECDV